MLVDIGSGRKGYSRAITVADKDYIEERNQAYRNAQVPSVIDHDGVNNHFGGKASIVFYCHRGEWLRLLGAD